MKRLTVCLVLTLALLTVALSTTTSSLATGADVSNGPAWLAEANVQRGEWLDSWEMFDVQVYTEPGRYQPTVWVVYIGPQAYLHGSVALPEGAFIHRGVTLPDMQVDIAVPLDGASSPATATVHLTWTGDAKSEVNPSHLRGEPPYFPQINMMWAMRYTAITGSVVVSTDEGILASCTGDEMWGFLEQAAGTVLMPPERPR